MESLRIQARLTKILKVVPELSPWMARRFTVGVITPARRRSSRWLTPRMAHQFGSSFHLNHRRMPNPLIAVIARF